MAITPQLVKEKHVKRNSDDGEADDNAWRTHVK
jgi:hypothetical protein